MKEKECNDSVGNRCRSSTTGGGALLVDGRYTEAARDEVADRGAGGEVDRWVGATEDVDMFGNVKTREAGCERMRSRPEGPSPGSESRSGDLSGQHAVNTNLSLGGYMHGYMHKETTYLDNWSYSEARELSVDRRRGSRADDGTDRFSLEFLGGHTGFSADSRSGGVKTGSVMGNVRGLSCSVATERCQRNWSRCIAGRGPKNGGAFFHTPSFRLACPVILTAKS